MVILIGFLWCIAMLGSVLGTAFLIQHVAEAHYYSDKTQRKKNMLELIIGIVIVATVVLVAMKAMSLVFGAIGLGKIVAAGMSISRNSSIGWAVVHFFCGWFYVIWWLCTGGPNKKTN